MTDRTSQSEQSHDDCIDSDSDSREDDNDEDVLREQDQEFQLYHNSKESEDNTDVVIGEHMFEMSNELEDSDSCIHVESVCSEQEQKDQISELHIDGDAENSDGGPDYVVYGTTPPRSGRFEKMANKSHKYKSGKKMSPGVGFTLAKPKVTLKGQKKVYKKEHSQAKDSSGSLSTPTSGSKNPARFLSPISQGADQSEVKVAKRKRKQQRKQERDSKSSLNEQQIIASPKLVHANSIDVVDYSSIVNSVSRYDKIGSNLQPFHLLGSSSNSLSSDTSRIRRVQSDFILSIQPLDERQYCPTDRKQYYRKFVNALKHSGIHNIVRPHLESTPTSTYHVARMRSENLALENPFGQVSEGIWLELKAYLTSLSLDSLHEQMYIQKNSTERVLSRLITFRMPLVDPEQSLNKAFQGIDQDDCRHLRSVPSTAVHSLTCSQTKRVGFSQPIVKDDCAGQSICTTPYDEPDLCEESVTAKGYCHQIIQQDSTDSRSSGEPDPVTFEPDEFLSYFHSVALVQVKKLLTDLEEVESLYPNRKSIGDSHPNYRTLNFKRRCSALILWHKVTEGLASKLSSLSKWLGVSVILHMVCQDPPPDSVPNDTEATARFPLKRQRSVELSGILACKNSSKSPTATQLKFSLGSHSSEEGIQQSVSLSTQISYVSNAQSSNSSATLPRLFSNYQSVVESHGPYRDFVNRSLKRKGLIYLMGTLLDFIKPDLVLAQYALMPPTHDDTINDENDCEHYQNPHLRHFINPALFDVPPFQEYPTSTFERSTSTGPENWVQEFELMNLPLFCEQYIRLVHVPLDVMHECLKLQLELKPCKEPSYHSVRQLVHECRETLEQAIKIRNFYREKINLVTLENPAKLFQVEVDIEEFEVDLKSVLEMYFDYLQSWAQVSSGHILEEEWRHVKDICTCIRGGEAEAGRRFCDMASRLLESTGDILETRMDECCRILHKSGEHPEQRRAAIVDSCRSFKELFVEIRERASKALGFAKMLRKDLEIAADFSIQASTPQLLQALQASDHVQVMVPGRKLDKLMFVTETTSASPGEIDQLLSVCFAHYDSKAHYAVGDCYLLLVNLDVTSSQSAWNGKTVKNVASAETIIAISEIQVESLKMIVNDSSILASCRNSFLNAVGSAVKLVNEQTSSHENVAERIVDLKTAACSLGSHLMHTALGVMEHLVMEEDTSEDLSKPYQATMHSCFNLGFEYVREVFRLVGDDMSYMYIGDQALEYAVLWIRFVLDKCDRGRGTRPRWATTGLEFMTVACAPRTLATISQTKFEALKKLMDRCLDHVVGEAPSLILNENHPTAARSAVRGRRKWRKTPKPPFGTRAFSEGLTLISQEEDEQLSSQNYPHFDSHTPIDIEQGIIRVDKAQVECRIEESLLPAGMLYDLPDDLNATDHPVADIYHPLAGVSPPVSTESIDSIEHSSGVDSPLHRSGEIANTSMIPIVTSTPITPLTTPFTTRMDSTTSASSASKYYLSSLSLSRTDSGLSSSSLGLCSEPERTKKIRNEVMVLDQNRERKLLQERIIGHVRARATTSRPDTKLSNLLQANFKWQRGRKLGEGRYGKVYECRNLTSGEINAVKQVSIQDRNSSAIQTVLDEINVFQKLQHENIVKFYGVEIHRNELYMFMEYCNEGTIWSIAQQGLTENMIRHYTRDIVKAVYFLHDNGIIHRDIKGSNIFLSSNGSIKLGDFGLSIQLKNYHKTMPNEIKQQVGTVPYMSPESILQQAMGRPMDIWSIGCVVVEMATGKLPWSECENQFQIMFQLGSGKTPPVLEIPVSDEGHDFLSNCFCIDPQLRWKAIQLLDHPFVKVDDGDSPHS